MQIKPDEITSILKSRIEGLDTSEAELTEVGTVLSVADGICRVHGLENCMSFEMLELPHDVTALALNLESDNVGAVLFGEWEKISEGDTVKRTGPPAGHPGRRGPARPDRRPAGQPAGRQGRDREHGDPPGRAQGPRRGPAPAGEGADAHRPEGDRLDDPDRPWPARADHRRPPDRQDLDRHRHDHQQQGPRPDLRLRRDRAAQGDRRPARQRAGGGGRAGEHDHRHGRRRRGGADQVPGALRRLRDGRALPLQRQGRADGLRRPHQARLRLSPDVAAAAPPAGPRGLPRRRVLPALTPAGARGQAQRRPRRRLAHLAADHRDPGRRRVGLHPHQRHLDHRRADLPGAQAVLLGRAPGDQRRHLGLPGGRQRPDRADAQGGRHAEARALAVPRPRGLRPVRLRARPRHPAHAGPRRAPGQDAQPVTSATRCRSRTRWPRSTPPPTATWTASSPTRWRSSSPSSASRCAATSPSCSRRSPAATGPTRPGRRSTRPSSTFAEDFGYDLDEEGHPIEEGDCAASPRRRSQASDEDDVGDQEDEAEAA